MADEYTIDTDRDAGWREYMKPFAVSVKCTVSEETIKQMEEETKMEKDAILNLIQIAPYLLDLTKFTCKNCGLREKATGMCPDVTCPVGHWLAHVGIPVRDIVKGFK